MKKMMSCQEAAWRWGISDRRVSKLCAEGRISGAYKEGRRWLLPENTPKPSDQRIKNALYVKEPTLAYRAKRPLPIGVSDYCRATMNYYYIDKTLMIKDVLDELPAISLFTRPRRFGKTLNMDMLRVFFENTGEDTSVYFRDKAIWQCGEKYRRHQGKYPVIFFTFKDIKFATWEESLEIIGLLFQREFGRHMELLESSRCSDFEKAYFQRVLSLKASSAELTQALSWLSKMLDAHYGVAPILIIDEYDTPIQQGHVRGYYDQVVTFMRNFFSDGLKDNTHISYGFLTGILRVAKESIFSGLNNLNVNSILEERYGAYFGFTPEEVRVMCRYYGVPKKYEEVCDWYDGYRFGNSDIFNPWSVINYFNRKCEPQAFWLSTSSNDIIGEVLQAATPEIRAKLADLMLDKTILTPVDIGIIYPQIKKNPASVYSFLLMTGYLKIVTKEQQYNGSYLYHVALPNKEIKLAYSKEILAEMEEIVSYGTVSAIQEALYMGDGSWLQEELSQFLMRTVSFYDTATESFYHGLLLGLFAVLAGYYAISSNRESGTGRYDIQLMPRKEGMPGILIELKTAPKGSSEAQLQRLAAEAIHQIKSCSYETELQRQGVDKIIRYGAAFCGKQVQIAAEAS